MTIPESFDDSSRKPKKMNTTRKKNTKKDKNYFKYIVRTENHGHRNLALIPC